MTWQCHNVCKQELKSHTRTQYCSDILSPPIIRRQDTTFPLGYGVKNRLP